MKKIECQQLPALNEEELEIVAGGSWSDRVNRGVARALGGGRWSKGCVAGAREWHRGRGRNSSSSRNGGGRKDNGRDRRDRRH